MKNYLKMTLFAGLFVLSILAISQASAQYYTYTPASSGYTDITDTVSYNEDLQGDNRGFSLRHTSTVPRTEVIRGCDYYDWTSNYRKCRRSSSYREDGYYENYGYNNYDRYHYDNFRAPYNQDRAVDLAFKTYQQSSKQRYQLDSQALNLRYQRSRSYGYGGYGSGYARYSWGW